MILSSYPLPLSTYSIPLSVCCRREEKNSTVHDSPEIWFTDVGESYAVVGGIFSTSQPSDEMSLGNGCAEVEDRTVTDGDGFA